jgi:hypothetical protein
MVTAFKDNHLKMQIGKGTELQVPIWHSGTHEAFLIHVGSALEAIERKGYFKAYVETTEAFSLLPVCQGTWCTLSAFPCVARLSVFLMCRAHSCRKDCG